MQFGIADAIPLNGKCIASGGAAIHLHVTLPECTNIANEQLFSERKNVLWGGA